MEKTKEKERESVQLWDERDGKWKVAYEKRVRRLETIRFLDAVLFDSAAETYTAKAFECAAYEDFTLLINLDVTGAPTDIKIQVQLSADGNSWYNLMDGPFGSLMYEDTAGDKTECVHGKVFANWYRIYVVSSGCTSSLTFKLTLDAIFSG